MALSFGKSLRPTTSSAHVISEAAACALVTLHLQSKRNLQPRRLLGTIPHSFGNQSPPSEFLFKPEKALRFHERSRTPSNPSQIDPSRIPRQRTRLLSAGYDYSQHCQLMTTTMEEPAIQSCFEPKTSTWQYLVADPTTKTAVIIDPVLDYDPATNTISTQTADGLLEMVAEKGYNIERLLETHAHADHLTAASYLQKELEAAQGFKPEIAIGKRIGQVQERFASRYGIEESEIEGVFDKLFDDDETFKVGSLEAKAIHLPGHTPDHLGYMIGGGNVFCGDSLFNTDVGSARADFPGGNARDLYNSVQKLLALPEHVKVWTGHDYPPGGEGRHDPRAYTTVAEQRRGNKHLKTGVAEDDFVKWRAKRDASLAAPKLLHQSLQFNIRAGRLPKLTEGGDRLLHLPLQLKGLSW